MAFFGSKSATLWAGGAVVAAALAAYANSFSGPFVLDDLGSIAGNPTIRHLWPPGGALSPPHGDGLTVEGRPVLNFSLALNYALGGTAVQGYHVANFAIHLAAGLILLGLARRTFRRWRGEESGVWPAVLLAVLWTAHPLQTEAVTYVVQRAESLMGFFYLLTLYAFVRGNEPREAGRGRGAAWLILSVAACALGMGTKEVMVSAPLLVLAYDRTFLAGSFAAAWRARRTYYASLAATWLGLAVLVWRTGSRGGTSGPGSGIAAGDYWLTQFPAVVRYLRLTVWPQPLVFDYGTEWVAGAGSVLPQMAAVLGLLAASGYAFTRPALAWRAAGFAGLWFFAVLAPTSLVPGNRQTAAEHRLYLALVPGLALGVGGIPALVGRRRRRDSFSQLSRAAGPVAWTVAIAGLGGAAIFLTAARNRDYRSALALFADTVEKRPDNGFAQDNLGVALLKAGRLDEAIGHARAAVRLRPADASIRDNLGNALLHAGQRDEAVAQFETALRLRPAFALAHDNLGVADAGLGRWPEALEQFEQAERLGPDSVETQNNLGNACLHLGHLSAALAHYRAALRLDPDSAEADNNLANALMRNSQPEEALAAYAAALRLDPAYAEALFNRGNALAQSGRLAEAVADFQAALRLKPASADVRINLGNSLLRLDRVAEAAEQFAEAVRLEPDRALGHYSLGNAWLRLGRRPEAAAQFHAALRLQPDFSAAAQVLRRLEASGADLGPGGETAPR